MSGDEFPTIGDGTTCKPYIFSPNEDTFPSTYSCSASCQPSYTSQDYVADKRMGGDWWFIPFTNDGAAVKYELMTRKVFRKPELKIQKIYNILKKSKLIFYFN